MNKATIIFTGLLGLVLAGSSLAQGNATAGESKSALCASCHGPGGQGQSQMPETPKLAGQNANYLIKQLSDFKSGARSDITMTAMAAGLSEQDMLDIAAYYAAQSVSVEGADPGSVEIAEVLYRAGNQDISVAACTACHSPTGHGNAPAGFPVLSGQLPQYTLKQLKAFRAGERGNDANAVMRTVVERLTDKELEALASYVSGLH